MYRNLKKRYVFSICDSKKVFISKFKSLKIHYSKRLWNKRSHIEYFRSMNAKNLSNVNLTWDHPYASYPIAHSTEIKEGNINMSIILDKIHYSKNAWINFKKIVKNFGYKYLLNSRKRVITEKNIFKVMQSSEVNKSECCFQKSSKKDFSARGNVQTFTNSTTRISLSAHYEGCSISPWLLERWCCYRKYVTTPREYYLISVRIQSLKSERWLENFLQPVEFRFSLL